MRILAHYALSEDARAELERIAQALMAGFAEGGCMRIALPALQPADLYLDMAGENVRERMFVFDDPLGDEICLRADLTIPVCRHVLDSAMKLPARIACLGPVYRFDAEGERAPTELLQAGVECLGESEAAGADAAAFGLARASLAAAGAGALSAEIGCVALFQDLVADLALAPVWARRLGHAFRHPSLLRPTLEALRAGRRDARSLPKGFSATSRSQAEQFVTRALALSPGESVYARTVGEIAERLLDKAEELAAPMPSAEALDIIAAFLALNGPAAEIMVRLKRMARRGGALEASLARFETTLDALRAHLGAGDELSVSTTLGRDFIYYTGLVFDLKAKGLDAALASGGRYDRLMSDLGAPVPIPAVGFALWPERVLAVRQGRG